MIHRAELCRWRGCAEIGSRGRERMRDLIFAKAQDIVHHITGTRRSGERYALQDNRKKAGRRQPGLSFLQKLYRQTQLTNAGKVRCPSLKHHWDATRQARSMGYVYCVAEERSTGYVATFRRL